MEAGPRLQAVVEAPWFEVQPPWPWPIADRPHFNFSRIHGAMSSAEVGSVFARLVSADDLPAGADASAALSLITEAESLILAGGIQAVQGDLFISPGCCCGLEGWRAWHSMLKTGHTPWLGHDPFPWLEARDDIIRLHADTDSTDHIDFTREQFRAGLDNVQRDLLAFLRLSEKWARSLGYRQVDQLTRKLDVAFTITKAAADAADSL